MEGTIQWWLSQIGGQEFLMYICRYPTNCVVAVFQAFEVTERSVKSSPEAALYSCILFFSSRWVQCDLRRGYRTCYTKHNHCKYICNNNMFSVIYHAWHHIMICFYCYLSYQIIHVVPSMMCRFHHYSQFHDFCQKNPFCWGGLRWIPGLGTTEKKRFQ